ncbi:MAG: hypothetical protein D6690_04490 [Nitrospirae bacterium]|nr:MAG: hypothetical protein D6690_04490 [Nitrospirota bacterium]
MRSRFHTSAPSESYRFASIGTVPQPPSQSRKSVLFDKFHRYRVSKLDRSKSASSTSMREHSEARQKPDP